MHMQMTKSKQIDGETSVIFVSNWNYFARVAKMEILRDWVPN